MRANAALAQPDDQAKELVCQDRPEAVWGSSPESRAPSELVSVDQCLTATSKIKSSRPRGTRRQRSRAAEAEMLAGLHFSLDFAAELGQRDPRLMLLGRS